MTALIIVDVQIDFLPGGPLAVAEGDQVVTPINRLMEKADLVIATQDWHPSDHGSFAENHEGKSPFDRIDLHGLSQTLWPVHCVQGSAGAEFAQGLDVYRAEVVVRKGVDPKVDSYSAFYDNGHRRSTGLAGYLRERGVDRVIVVGLATDYCVKFTALDAAKEGFETYVVEEACRGVDLCEGDVAAAIGEMREAGVTVLSRVGDLV